MKYLILSYTHKNTDIVTREKLACNTDEALHEFYTNILNLDEVKESVILSTCNRVEIFLVVKKYDDIINKVKKILSKLTSATFDEIDKKGAVYQDKEAVKHIFLVASSLDSLVIGETQITGQLKDAFRFSFDNGYCGQSTARVMMNAFKCSQKVRSSTQITKHPVSVASVAVAKAKEIFGGNLGGYTGVVIGVGEMGELVSKHLAKAGANIVLVNRDIEKAYELAKKLDEVTVIVEPFSKLKEIVNHYRLLFSATGAPTTIIDEKLVEPVSFERYWFDIAVPRDIADCSCNNISIYAVDDLEEIVNRNIKEREENAQEAFLIAEQQVEEFYKWLSTLSIEPVIKELRLQAQNCAKSELERAIKKGFISKEMEKSVFKLIQNTFKSFLHTPTKNLKAVSDLPKGDVIVQSTQYLFDINIDTQKKIDTYKCDYLIEKDLFKKGES